MRPLPFDPSSPGHSPDSATPPPPGDAAAAASFDLVKHEFRRTILTQPVVTIKSKIQTSLSDPGIAGLVLSETAAPPSPSTPTNLLLEVLEPARGTVEAALRSVRPRRLSRLVSDYFDGSESTSRLCLLLHRSVLCTRNLYSPLLDLLETLPTAASSVATSVASSPGAASSMQNRSLRRRIGRCLLSSSECDQALQIFLEFDSQENPFLHTTAAPETLRRRLDALAEQLKSWLRRDRLHRRAAAGAAVCLGVAVVGAAVSAVVVTGQGGPAAGAGLAVPLLCCSGDTLWRRRRERKAQVEKAAKGIFGLSRYLETMERLARLLYDAVEGDRALVRKGLLIGRDDRSFMAELVRQLRQSRGALLKKLDDLENHVCVFLTVINSARWLLFDHFDSPDLAR